MLLIGSRATKFHFPFARNPKDYDFIARIQEVDHFKSLVKCTDISTHEKKVKLRVELDKPTLFEFELIEHCASARQLESTHFNFYKNDKQLGIVYRVASPEALFLLKKSHLCFNIHWKKNMQDFLYLKERIDEKKISPGLNYFFNTRFNEVKERVKFKDRNFDVDNSEFFRVSEKMLNRMVPHDNIHFATCFFNRPLFMEVKDDLSRAEMNQIKVFNLAHELKIKLIQEETMALAIERYILPCVRDKKPYDAQAAYVNTACRMVYNYLPMFLKFFAIDNFLEILDLKIDYVDKFFRNVKGLSLPHENVSHYSGTD